MIMRIFSIFDNKTVCYSKPFYCLTQAEAIRTFGDAVNTTDSPFNAHPSDYSLFEIGTFEDSSGMLDKCDPLHLGSALNYHNIGIEAENAQ